jgi:Icc-related predicted phosphoesterase
MAVRIEALVARLHDPEQAVFNFHCPPHGTHLDQAPMLDAELRPQVRRDRLKVGPVGSTAVREAIEQSGPLLGLHGHVHESPAAQKVGRTLCVNPGSEYGDGILRGAIVDLDRPRASAAGRSSRDRGSDGRDPVGQPGRHR